jgi:protease II
LFFAIAHRGGEDLGRQWYEDGKLLKEKYFTDFIDFKVLINENLRRLNIYMPKVVQLVDY